VPNEIPSEFCKRCRNNAVRKRSCQTGKGSVMGIIVRSLMREAACERDRVYAGLGESQWYKNVLILRVERHSAVLGTADCSSWKLLTRATRGNPSISGFATPAAAL